MRKGNCYDSAPLESFWGKLKMEWLPLWLMNTPLRLVQRHPTAIVLHSCWRKQLNRLRPIIENKDSIGPLFQGQVTITRSPPKLKYFLFIERVAKGIKNYLLGIILNKLVLSTKLFLFIYLKYLHCLLFHPKTLYIIYLDVSKLYNNLLH